MSLSKPLTLRHLCHLLNNILGLFYHRHIVFLTISLVKNIKCYLPKNSALNALYISKFDYLFLCTLYIDNTFRAYGKDSPDKKPRARLIYITIRVNQI